MTRTVGVSTAPSARSVSNQLMVARTPLQPIHWVYAVVTLLLVILFFGVLALPEWYYWDLVERRSPVLQRCFKFAASEMPSPSASGVPETVFTITAVHPESVLAQAGLRAGDLPVGYAHGMINGFYSDLEAVLDGYDVTFDVLATTDWQRGHNGWRTVHVAGVRMQCE